MSGVPSIFIKLEKGENVKILSREKTQGKFLIKMRIFPSEENLLLILASLSSTSCRGTGSSRF